MINLGILKELEELRQKPNKDNSLNEESDKEGKFIDQQKVTYSILTI